MNILFFLKPKAEVAFVYDYHTLRQAMEIMEYHKYSSIPMINREGKYVGTITEGDLLWGLKKLNILNLKEAEDIAITKIAEKSRLPAGKCRFQYGRSDGKSDGSELCSGH